MIRRCYDLDAAQLWEKMEEIIRRVSEGQDVLSMTHLEIVRYIRAMDQAVIGEDSIENRSDMVLWFRVDGEVVPLQPEQAYRGGNVGL